MLLNCGVEENSWESLGLQGGPTSPSYRRSVLGVHWKNWCWSWNSNTLATWCEELTHLKRLWCWEGLRAGGEGDNRGWDGWMASLIQWTRVWVDSRSWWRTGRPARCNAWGFKKLDMTERLNWTELNHTVLITVALQYNLKTGRLIPPGPFFFLKTALAIRVFCVSIWIVKYFVLVLWKMPLVIW